MDHSGYEDEGRLSTTVPSGDSLSGGKSTQNVTASTATDGGDVLAAAGRIKSAQQKCSSDCVTVSGSSNIWLSETIERTNSSFRTLPVETPLKIKLNFIMAPSATRVTVESS